MIPNTFIPGAPKCGTTSLASWLAQHPCVFTPKIKEPHYFFSPYGEKIKLEEYEALYADAGPDHHVQIDASTWYFYSDVAISRILEVQPEARFIICLRNPMEMAISLHNQKVFSGYELERNFNLAWHLSAEREDGCFTKVAGISEVGDSRHMSYRLACKLGTFLEQARLYLSEDKYHVVFLDDVETRPREVLDGILDFLDLPLQHVIDLAPQNRAKRWRSPLLKRALHGLSQVKKSIGFTQPTNIFAGLHVLNTQKKQPSSPVDDVMQEMRLAFYPEIDQLAALTNRDLDHWKT